MVSLRRLAELAGVSHVTVLHALRGDARMRPETRQRILELAALYAYERQPSEQGKGKSGLIGILVSDISSVVFSRVLKGTLEEAFAHDYRVVTLESHHNLQHVCKAIEVFIDQRVEGLILAPGVVEQVPLEYLYHLQSQGIHTVAATPSVFSSPIDCVYSDPHQVSEQVVGYLMGLGHRFIAYAGQIQPLRGEYNQDCLAFLEVVKKLHLPYPLCYDTSTMSAADIVQNVIRRTQQPTAIVTLGDRAALSLLNMLKNAGYHIPQDISLVAIGDYGLTTISVPTITAVEQSIQEIGNRAVQIICNHIQREDIPSALDPETIYIAPKLVIRESCAKPRIGRIPGT